MGAGDAGSGALGAAKQYALTRVSYIYPVTSARYLIGLLLCAPLVARHSSQGYRPDGAGPPHWDRIERQDRA